MANPVSFRLPSAIPEGVVHPQVKQAVENNTRSVVDLNQANVALTNRIAALEKGGAVANAATGTSVNTTTNTENVTTATVMGAPVNNQSGVSAYSTVQTDDDTLIILNSPTAVAVTLNYGVTTPWFCYFLNQGGGVVTLTPQQGTINGVTSQTINDGFFSIVFFDGSNFWSCVIPNVPLTLAAVAHQFLTGYNAATGLFSTAQPAFTDISGMATSDQVPALSALNGQITLSQLPATGLNVTITTAALTVTGTQGSMTFSNGLLTAQNKAT